ncbi:MAG: DNA polymerase III subunit beta [Bacillota bacterium]
MHILIDKENLITALSVVQKATSVNSPLPILSGIHFKTSAEGVVLSATNLEIGISTSVAASVQTQGGTVLPAKYIFDLTRRLPETTIEIITDQDINSTIIKYADSEVNLHGFAEDEFPSFSALPDIPVFKINQESFRNILKKVVFAVSTEEYRPIFTGVLFDLNRESMTIVATDTHRLALQITPIELGIEESQNFIIPGKTLYEIIKVISSNNSLISIYLSPDNKIIFRNDNTVITSRLIEGVYPHYKQVIPTNFISSFSVITKDLLNAIERTIIFAYKSEPIRIHIDETYISIFLNSEVGRIREELPIKLKGKVMDLAFNPYYLIDALKVIDTDEVIIKLTGETSAAIIQPTEDSNYISLLLPTRLKI